MFLFSPCASCCSLPDIPTGCVNGSGVVCINLINPYTGGPATNPFDIIYFSGVTGSRDHPNLLAHGTSPTCVTVPTPLVRNSFYGLIFIEVDNHSPCADTEYTTGLALCSGSFTRNHCITSFTSSDGPVVNNLFYCPPGATSPSFFGGGFSTDCRNVCFGDSPTAPQMYSGAKAYSTSYCQSPLGIRMTGTIPTDCNAYPTDDSSQPTPWNYYKTNCEEISFDHCADNDATNPCDLHHTCNDIWNLRDTAFPANNCCPDTINWTDSQINPTGCGCHNAAVVNQPCFNQQTLNFNGTIAFSGDCNPTNWSRTISTFGLYNDGNPTTFPYAHLNTWTTASGTCCNTPTDPNHLLATLDLTPPLLSCVGTLEVTICGRINGILIDPCPDFANCYDPGVPNWLPFTTTKTLSVVINACDPADFDVYDGATLVGSITA